MAHIDDLMDATSSKFHLVMLAAKRAREINNYYQQLGEGSGRWVAPLVSTESSKPLTVALEEIAEHKIIEEEPVEVIIDDPLAFISEQEVVLDDDAPAPLTVVPDLVDDAGDGIADVDGDGTVEVTDGGDEGAP